MRVSIFLGTKTRIFDFIKRHAAACTLLLIIFLTSISYCEQANLAGGNLMVLFFALAAMSFGAFAFMRSHLGLKSGVSCAALFCLLALSFIFVYYLGQTRAEKRAVFLLSAAFIALFAVFLVLLVSKRLNAENAVILLFLAGFFLRYAYVLYTSCTTRQHDAGWFNSHEGHFAYVRYLFENGRLPDFDVRERAQFYHPPLHYALCAAWWRLFSFFGVDDYRAYDSMQSLTLFYSCVCLIITYKILREFNLKGAAAVIPFAIAAFHPTFVIFAASINNDVLSVTFMLLAILFSIKWYKSRSVRDIVITALAIGLGMMTKLSAYMVAFGVGFIFIAAFVKDFKNYKKYLLQFSVFLAICAPLGLWWQIRNAVKFGMPLFYARGLDSSSDWQYLGDIPAATRLFDFSKLFTAPVFDQWTDRGTRLYNEYNPMISLLKTSVFGEFITSDNFVGTPIFNEIILFWVNFVFAIGAVAAIVFTVVSGVKNKSLGVPELSLITGFAAILINYYIFCFKFPHHCSQNIRYASPLIIIGLLFIGKLLSSLNERAAADGAATRAARLCNAFKYAVGALAVVFCATSAIMFTQI